MSWAMWLLLGVVLVLGAAGVLGLLAWRAFQAGLRLTETLATAMDRLPGRSLD